MDPAAQKRLASWLREAGLQRAYDTLVQHEVDVDSLAFFKDSDLCDPTPEQSASSTTPLPSCTQINAAANSSALLSVATARCGT